jgi:glutathione S-transferase
MPDPAITLHGTKLSGHAHRVELLLRMLGLPYAYRDAPAAVRATPAFLALNPLGQVPVLEDGSLVLADSNAILAYLARRYDPAGHWLPDAPESAAAVQRWLSIAAGEVSFGPAAARAITLWNMRGDADPVRAKAIAGRLLAFMEGHLASPRAFLAAGHASERAAVAPLLEGAQPERITRVISWHRGHGPAPARQRARQGRPAACRMWVGGE